MEAPEQFLRLLEDQRRSFNELVKIQCHAWTLAAAACRRHAGAGRAGGVGDADEAAINIDNVKAKIQHAVVSESLERKLHTQWALRDGRWEQCLALPGGGGEARQRDTIDNVKAKQAYDTIDNVKVEHGSDTIDNVKTTMERACDTIDNFQDTVEPSSDTIDNVKADEHVRESLMAELRVLRDDLAFHLGWGPVKYDIRRALKGTGWQGMATFTGIGEAVMWAAATSRGEALDNVLVRVARETKAEVQRRG